MINIKKPLDQRPKYDIQLEVRINMLEKKLELFKRIYSKLLNEITNSNDIAELIRINKINFKNKNKRQLSYYADKKDRLPLRYIDLIDLFMSKEMGLIQTINRIEQLYKLVDDIKALIEDKIRNNDNIIIEYGFDKSNNLMCFIADLNKLNFQGDKQIINCYVLIGVRNSSKDYGEMVLKYHFGKPTLEVASIKAGREKRMNRGSFFLNMIEKRIINEINKRINEYNKNTIPKDYIPYISCIYGESGRLSLANEVDTKSRRNFYIKNGYSFNCKSSFYKFI